ncbi:MAG TPA: deoxyribose-phosphate aldolase [Thermoanaerobaculia bacterium]|jgi:deoxyribose-phosphate aldolase|nr:deoxyribose-phosphate aldolase [Thermoanaerobaculia bacterium]
MTTRPLATYIDHTLLRPDAVHAAYEKLAAEAAEQGFASVCVPPVWVSYVAERLAGTAVRTGTVIGFPFGYVHPETRRAESLRALADGALELDTVIDLSWLKSEEPWPARALADLEDWVKAVRQTRPDATLKVILETALLSDAEKVRGVEIAVAAGADYVKTSTGFGPGGATVEDVALLAKVAAGRARIKASGGIRDFPTASAMIAAGADRIGTSNGVAILAQSQGSAE